MAARLRELGNAIVGDMDYTYNMSTEKRRYGGTSLSYMGNFSILSVNLIMAVALFIVYGTIECYRNHNVPLMYQRQIFTTNPVTVSSMGFPSGNEGNATLTEPLGDLKIIYDTQFSTNFDIGLTLPFIPLLPVLGAVLEFFMNKETQLSVRQNRIRWLVDSIANPLLGTILWASFYELDMFSLLSMFALLHIATVLGLVLEMSNAPNQVSGRSGIAFSPLLISMWVALFAIVPPIVYVATASGVSQIPLLIWWATGFYIFLLVWNTLVQAMYYGYLSMPGEGLFFKLSCGSQYNYAVYESLLAVGQTIVRNICVAIIVAALVPCDRYDYPNIMQFNVVT